MTQSDHVLLLVTFLLVCIANALFLGRISKDDPKADGRP